MGVDRFWTLPIFNSFVEAEVVVDLEQPTRKTPMINMTANDTNRTFFTVVPPYCDLFYLPYSSILSCYFVLSYPPFFRRELSHLDNSPYRAEVLFYGITCSTIGTFFKINDKVTISFNNCLGRADTIPHTGMALYAFLTDFVYHKLPSQ
jgi:hypothetical protein